MCTQCILIDVRYSDININIQGGDVLDTHFQPQTNGNQCPAHANNNIYSDMISTERLPGSLNPLATHLGISLAKHPFPHTHVSPAGTPSYASEQPGAHISANEHNRAPISKSELTKVRQVLKRIQRLYLQDFDTLSPLAKEMSTPPSRATLATVRAILWHDDPSGQWRFQVGA